MKARKLMFILSIFALVGCEVYDYPSNYVGYPTESKENGNEQSIAKPSDSAIVTAIKFYDGAMENQYTTVKQFDFINNVYSYVGHYITRCSNEDNEAMIPNPLKCGGGITTATGSQEFTDEEENILISKLQKNHFFSLEQNYGENKSSYNEWHIVIEFKNGRKKISNGYNAYPEDIFLECCTNFYDLVKDPIIAELPPFYADTPYVETRVIGGEYSSFEYERFTSAVSGRVVKRAVKANYKWYTYDVKDVDYYQVNQKNVPIDLEYNGNWFDKSISYKLKFDTTNYTYKDKFTNFEVTEYDYNAQLTNKTTVLKTGFFTSETIDLQLNKIYVIRLDYADGRFVEYALPTAVAND